MVRAIALVITSAFVVGACSSIPAATTTRPVETTTRPVETTAAASTTTAPTTTTTTPPPTVRLYLSGVPEPLAELVGDLYIEAHTSSSPPLDLPPGLDTLVENLDPGEGRLTIRAAAGLGEILETPIAVITAGDDVILAVADPTWRIVGAKLARFGLPASYGSEPKFLLVVGSDARPGENPLRSRADSLHIVAMVPSSGAETIVGIPRDSYVTTPDGLTDKFTSVLSRRGVDTLLATARELTSLPIDGYVLTGFEGFTGLVDDLGGIVLDVPFAMADRASQAFFQPGEQMLDGAAALAFSRNRHLRGGDFTRSHDQGLVMLAGLRAVRLLGIRRLPASLELLTDHTTTDLDAAALLTMGATIYESGPVSNVVADGVPDRVNGSSIVRLTDDALATFQDLADGTLESP
ncbi:MAG: LCP family protein [Actinobacteria bacterium]|nr:LCP family protein [Actinomycetota bacterium]